MSLSSFLIGLVAGVLFTVILSVLLVVTSGGSGLEDDEDLDPAPGFSPNRRKDFD